MKEHAAMRSLLLVSLVVALTLPLTAGAEWWDDVSLPDGPSAENPRLSDVAVNDGVVWFSTDLDGLLAYDGSTWVLHAVADGGLRSNAWHNTIMVDSNGDKWTSKDGTQTVDRVNDGGTFTDKSDDTWTYYSQGSELQSGRVFSIEQDLQGNMWFGIRDENGTESSMIELLIENGPGTDDDEWLAFGGTFDPQIFFAEDVRGLEMDGQGRLWIVYYRAGVDVWDFGDYHSFDDDTIIHYGSVDGLPSDAIYAVHAGLDGRVWAGGDGGIAVLEPTSETWMAVEGLSSDRVVGIDTDPQGHVWVATDDGVAMLYRTQEVAYVHSTEVGLCDDEVTLIAVGQSDGTVWAVSEDLGASQGSCLSVLGPGFAPEPRVFVYPNPWNERQTAERSLKILGVPDGSTVKIFDITGQLVREFDAGPEPFVWDSLDSNLNEVTSGVYIVRVVTPSGEQLFTKAAIIR
jgi:ligand-binding sensor domain-containing protein